MPDLIFVSGSINAGKSTVSRLLVERLHQGRRRAAHVQGDELRHFVTQLPLEDAIPVTLQNIIAMSKTFLVAGFDVVVDYPLYRPSYERLREALVGSATAVHAFVLSPPPEAAQGQRGERVLSPHEVARIAYYYRTGLHDPGFGVRIGNARQTPQGTAELILRHLGR